ncbi:MAG: hypothetical protein FJ292_09820 [Planctomycetes bacterium]|nr:hypothetical protein [Planctomycetota bacterium]
MRAELIHTSLPRGLDGGTGFSVAGRTGGMPRGLAEALSALSGLPEAWPDAREDQRVLHATRCIEWQGESRWVASVIRPSGVDHTGRGNRLAHHRLIDAQEIVRACPVAILQDSARWMQAWSGTPREMESPSEIGAMPGAVGATHWKRAFGDEGVAVAALEAAMQSGVGAWIVVPSEVDRLTLLAELAATLPLPQRWTRGWATRALRPSAGSMPVICVIGAREPALETLGDPAWVIRADSLRPAPRATSAKIGVEAEIAETRASGRLTWQPERRLGVGVVHAPDAAPSMGSMASAPSESVPDHAVPIAVTLEEAPASRSWRVLWLAAVLGAVILLGWFLLKGRGA